MNKKKYEAPVVKRVKLEIKNTILSVCFSSLIIDPTPDCRTPIATCSQLSLEP